MEAGIWSSGGSGLVGAWWQQVKEEDGLAGEAATSAYV